MAVPLTLRIVGTDLPRSCGPAPDRPDGHHDIEVAVQGRKGQHDLLPPATGGPEPVRWELPCQLDGSEITGRWVCGRPGQRFVYLSWSAVGQAGGDDRRMFRRAKILLDRVPEEVLRDAERTGTLTGRLGLTDSRGNPRCASVDAKTIEWTTAAP